MKLSKSVGLAAPIAVQLQQTDGKGDKLLLIRRAKAKPGKGMKGKCEEGKTQQASVDLSPGQVTDADDDVIFFWASQVLCALLYFLSSKTGGRRILRLTPVSAGTCYPFLHQQQQLSPI